MKLPALIPTTLLAFACSLGLLTSAYAQTPAASAKEKPVAAPPDSAAVAKARASYPLKTCIVSDEKLGDMGEAYAYVHREAGKPDRIVFFCCDGCVDDFKADPAKYLKKLDAASAEKGGKKKGSKKADAAKQQ